MAIAARAAQGPKASSAQHSLGRALSYLVLGIWTVLMGFPLYWMLSTALMTEVQANAYPPAWFPNPVVLRNFYDSMVAANFGRYFLNSVLVSLVAVVFTLFFSSLAGYTFGQLSFPGRNLLFAIVMATMMVPGQVTMIPVFLMLKRFPLTGGNDLLGVGGSGLLNTYPALIIPHISAALGIFLMRQFTATLPPELGDAGRIDGCSEFGIFWRIILPLTGPALVTLGLFNFAAVWNDFTWALIVTNTEPMRTVQLGLSVFRGIYYTQTTLFMAGTAIATLPVLIIFLLGQRYFVRGVALSGIKG